IVVSLNPPHRVYHTEDVRLLLDKGAQHVKRLNHGWAAYAVRTGDAGEVQPRLADCWTAAARRHITSRLAWLCLRLSRLLP
ncbi:hypothetical protein K0U83_00925, partial [bacterium]|nr:hypothetical protein [bacterium]